MYKTRQEDTKIFIDLFPQGVRPFILHVKDVESDENCGYRVIGGLVDLGEWEWEQVRCDLLKELYTHNLHYIQIYGSPCRFDKVAHILHTFNLLHLMLIG